MSRLFERETGSMDGGNGREVNIASNLNVDISKLAQDEKWHIGFSISLLSSIR